MKFQFVYDGTIPFLFGGLAKRAPSCAVLPIRPPPNFFDNIETESCQINYPPRSCSCRLKCRDRRTTTPCICCPGMYDRCSWLPKGHWRRAYGLDRSIYKDVCYQEETVETVVFSGSQFQRRSPLTTEEMRNLLLK